ncbi:hypothetical protein B0T17DRAFT_506900 [Bombardia bombarda]|uniref:Uncharacterized protein n=1 Tax=Bombardia bombarda TaxID=252184 RepID=A0AA39XAN8_9PEZI|nr:hypothetical protein B0T17DRAFT_506900 [Bombardia bombarda]
MEVPRGVMLTYYDELKPIDARNFEITAARRNLWRWGRCRAWTCYEVLGVMQPHRLASIQEDGCKYSLGSTDSRGCCKCRWCRAKMLPPLSGTAVQCYSGTPGHCWRGAKVWHYPPSKPCKRTHAPTHPRQITIAMLLNLPGFPDLEGRRKSLRTAFGQTTITSPIESATRPSSPRWIP